MVGSEAGFTSYGLEPLEGALKEGARPADPGFAEVTGGRTGVVGVPGAQREVPLERGRYDLFYRGVAASLLDGAPPPVDPRDSVAVIELVERLHRDVPVR
ncbi:hypothetical protein [Ornithinimicrobium cerasi]|uniref:hypothetical protein n=1 Tax=Ornithinimicrobium cerasi TaxID=2248773 RepID=UPI000EFF14B2|nr:hypothetical protein [Ornithinimicrobium cerasi]